MLLVGVISVCAAVSFGITAKKKGYDSPRFWIYPLAAGAGIILLGFAAGWMIRSLIKNEESLFLKLYPYLVATLSVAFLCAIILKAWKQIKSLPPKTNQG